MSFLSKIKNEKILIVGYSSKTGQSVAKYLSENNINYAVSDIKKDDLSVHFLQELPTPPFKAYFGEQNESQLDGINRIIIAPGVPRSIPLLKKALEKNIPVDTEISFTCAILEEKKIKLIGITGTDGKSTTSALTYHFLRQKYNTYLLGNFGEPFITQASQIKDGDYVVLELSSYQLEDGEKYRMNGATILNVAPDHLNRYGDMTEYRKAKEKIFINQKSEDLAVLNKDSEFYEAWKNQTKAIIKTISLKNKADFYYKNGIIYFKEKPFIDIKTLKIKGMHNVENVMIACAFGDFFGLSEEQMIEASKSFEGLEHRCEFAGVHNGITFINDSKATTVQAVMRGLSSSDGNIILILGGSDKNLDFSELNPYLDSKIKKVICYGETGNKINQALTFKNKEVIFEFDKAFHLAVSSASKGDTVLLSPGCASFDQFNSYDERGKKFKALVKQYAEKNS